MTCVLSVLIFLLGQNCIKKGPFLVGWNNHNRHRTVAGHAAGNKNFPFHYTVTQITLEDFGFVFRRGKNPH